MNEILRRDAETIARGAIRAVCPDEAVRRALQGKTYPGRVYLAAVGKAAWQMAQTAAQCLPHFEQGIAVTKYDHVRSEIPGVTCYEAGHPIPDENGFRGTQAILDMTEHLRPDDTVLFLLSGGGSALFEKPLVPAEELRELSAQLLACGADIVEINTIRKRLSAVKGGRFALWCAPARVETVALSDVLGDPPDMIASGPTAADSSTVEQAQNIARKYRLSLSAAARDCISRETPKVVPNSHIQIIGSVRLLCEAAAEACRALGYRPILLSDSLSCEARAAGKMLADKVREHAGKGEKLAFLAGGETVVSITGTGLGGRNQELAFAAADGIRGLSDAAVISVGSDGTDGPTDAAGGYVDGDTFAALEQKGIDFFGILQNNDSYHALEAVNGLIKTGPTGTNVNDIAIGLVGA